eukprot:scaffold8323_cov46-Cyclotella_meneghiniana.AAC.2
MSSYWEPSYHHLISSNSHSDILRRSSKYSRIRAVLVMSCIAVSTLVVTHLSATRIIHFDFEPGSGRNCTGRSSLHSSASLSHSTFCSSILVASSPGLSFSSVCPRTWEKVISLSSCD